MDAVIYLSADRRSDRRAETWMTLAVVALISAGTIVAARRLTRVAPTVCLTVAICVWLLCGRTVVVDADGPILFGWFFLHTATLDLRDTDEGQEEYARRARMKVTPFGFLEVKAGEREARLFVGPILARQLTETLRYVGFTVVGDK
jgi:hypothetical protein